MRFFSSLRARVAAALVLSSLVSIGLYLAAVAVNNDWLFGWFVGNLALAWVPLILSFALIRVLAKKRWGSWQALLLTLLWLLFLPNSFYIVTDYIHLVEHQREQFMLDIIMLTSFVANGLVLGYFSLYLVHQQLRRHLDATASAWLVALVLFIASYGIFMGRFLRRNSWDIIADAPSVLFEVSDTIVNSGSYQHLVPTVFGFFTLLGGLYIVIWQTAAYLRRQKSS